MVYSVANANEQQYIRPGFLACAGGTVAGFMVSGLPAMVASQTLLPKFTKEFIKSSKVDKDEYIKINKAATQTLQEKGLVKEGVTILRYSPETAEEIAEIIKKNNPILSKIKSKFIKRTIGLPDIDSYKEGTNANYFPKLKKIVMPEKELSLGIFHEMGHASNNFDLSGKLLQKSKYLGVIGLPVLLIALLKTKKAPNEEANSTISKTTDFIKNNAGKLIFLAMLPNLAEEGLASIKGIRFAKKVLDPTLVQKMSKSYKFAFLTYLTTTLATSIGIALAVKVKDAITKHKLVNTENKS